MPVMKLRASLATAALTSVLLVSGTVAAADKFINSSECSPSDSTVLLCDDWEKTDGRTSWAKTYWDVNNLDNYGWAMTGRNKECGGENNTQGCGPGTVIGFNGGEKDFIRCGSNQGVAGGCGAYSGKRYGMDVPTTNQTPAMGMHDFKQGVSEFYLRFYVRFTAFHKFGGNHKLPMSINNPLNAENLQEGIYFGNAWTDGTQGSTGTEYTFTFQVHGTNATQNQGNDLVILNDNHWYYIEQHLIMNSSGSPNGTLEIWINDCGFSGVCTGVPTLRTRYTNIKWKNAGDSTLFGSIWLENYVSPGATDGEAFYDQLVVRTQGPIGFYRGADMTPPVAPTALMVR